MKTQKKRRLLALLFALIACVCDIAMSAPEAQSRQTLSRLGSSGEEVRLIQEELADRGLYKGKIDGIYGTKTRNAVKLFQRKKGLTVDGIAGKQTINALGIAYAVSRAKDNANSNDIKLLARIISGEARGEPYLGQVAVGAVVLNRVESPSFPNTISGVIFQPKQFTAVTDGNFDKPVPESCYRAARDALNGNDPTGGCLYYFDPDHTRDAFLHSLPIKMRIGNHVFSKGKRT